MSKVHHFMPHDEKAGKLGEVKKASYVSMRWPARRTMSTPAGRRGLSLLI